TYVDIGGDVNATSSGGKATGIESVAYGTYDNTVTVGGSVNVSGKANAYGVIASGGDIYVGVTGDVTVASASRTAGGVVAVGDNSVHIGGNVSVTAAAAAYGVEVGGADGYAYVGGNVSAISTVTGNARGVYGNATGDVGIHVGGDVYAKAANGAAFG